jgi:hypothetical protein
MSGYESGGTFDAAKGRSNARTCAFKRTYSSWSVARDVAKRQRRADRDVVHPYRCRSCSQYHVGTVPEVEREI